MGEENVSNRKISRPSREVVGVVGVCRRICKDFDETERKLEVSVCAVIFCRKEIESYFVIHVAIYTISVFYLTHTLLIYSYKQSCQ
jgi:hypothetical protein